MSEESKRRRASASDASGGWDSNVARVLLTSQQLDTATAESLRVAWRAQHSYIDHLEAFNQLLKGSLKKAKEIGAMKKQQCAELQRREKILVQRLAAKEHQIQDYVSQITELKSSRASLSGRASLFDPAVNMLIVGLKQRLAATKARLEETENELSAWKFTPDSNTGSQLMAKCRLLHQENEELGQMTSSGRVAKLEAAGGECSDKMRSGSVVSFYNEEEEPLTDTKGEVN